MSFSKAPPLSARSTALRHWSSPAGGNAPARPLSSNVMPIARIYALILGPFGTIRGNGQSRASPQALGFGRRANPQPQEKGGRRRRPPLSTDPLRVGDSMADFFDVREDAGLLVMVAILVELLEVAVDVAFLHDVEVPAGVEIAQNPGAGQTLVTGLERFILLASDLRHFEENLRRRGRRDQRAAKQARESNNAFHVIILSLFSS